MTKELDAELKKEQAKLKMLEDALKKAK